MLAEGESLSGKEKNSCFLNTGFDENGNLQAFADVSAASGFNFIDDSRSFGTVDWDFDGDLDLWLVGRTSPQVRFLRNNNQNNAHFIALHLTGIESNRDGIGARVEVHLGTEKTPRIQTLRAGEGYLSQSSKWIHFGLGEHETIRQLVIKWPNGIEDRFQDVTPDQFYQATEGNDTLVTWDPPKNRITPSPQEEPPHFTSTDQARIVLSARPQTLPIAYETLDGEEKNLSDHHGEPELIVLWATWCQPCISELKEFTEHAEDFKTAGLRIKALNIDERDGTDSAEQRTKAKELLYQLKFPFDSGALSPEGASQFNAFQKVCLSRQTDIALPISFLVDQNNQLAAIYKGSVTREQLFEDTQQLSSSPHKHRELSVPFPGRWLGNPTDRNAIKVALKQLDEGHLELAIAYLEDYTKRREAGENKQEGFDGRPLPEVFYTLGSFYLQKPDFDGAVAYYKKAIELKSNYHKAHHDLGRLLLDHGRIKESIPHLTRAVELKPSDQATICSLSLAELMIGNLDQALAHAKSAVERFPKYPAAHYSYGLALQKKKEWRASLEAYKTTIQLDKGWLLARNNIAWILSTASDDVRNGTAAVRFMEPVVKLGGADLPVFLRTLAAGYAESGDFEKAITTVDQAITVAKKSKPALAGSLEKEKELYAQKQCVRD